MALIDDTLYKTMRKIQIETTHLAEGLFAGMYRSAFKGKGIEFEDVREFQTGDEIRSVDWNVTAKMGYPYVKNFREERELTVMLIVDVSSSTRFGSANASKSKLIAEIGALIAFSAVKNNDRVGLLMFSDRVEQFLAPKKGTRHVLRIIRDLLVTPQPNKKTDLSKALAYFGKVQRKSSICFVISDFMCPDCSHELTLLSKKHDLIVVSVIDPYEMTFPNVNLAQLVDLETGNQQMIDTGSPARQQAFVESSEKHLKELKTLMGKIGGGFIDIRTDRPYFKEIERFFQTRGRRVR
ncbi:MAG: DUF58 domain-containing protein [Parachlamydiaceae bacterium]